MTNIAIDHTTFTYVEEGSGEPLILVHGSFSDYRTWQAQLEPFSRHFRTLAYSRRYHWPNDPIPEGRDYVMSEHVDDLAALIPKLDAAPAHLVGHSYGAFVCLLLAIRAPELVRTLVLAEPPAITLFVSNQPQPSELLPLLLTRPRTAIAIMKFGMQGAAPATEAVRQGNIDEAIRIFGHATLGPEAYARLSDGRRQMVRANFIEAEFLGSGFAPLDDEQVRGVETPTLLLNGEDSPALFHRVVDRLHELLPHSERVVIPHASHISHEDNPAAYQNAVLPFLMRHQAA